MSLPSGILAAVEHVPLATMQAGLLEIQQSPEDGGTVELIVRRPAEDEREVLTEATLDNEHGLVGDRWRTKARTGEHGEVLRDTQLTLMNARAASIVAGDPDRRPLSGDQLIVDLDLRGSNLPPGTRLALGQAIIEVTPVPHTGCGKFARRFGVDAQRFVNSKEGRELNLRGVNAKVIVGGVVRTGDRIEKLPE